MTNPSVGDPLTEIVLATSNPGKVAEMKGLLATAGIAVSPRPDGMAPTVEDADSLVGNATKKAHEVVGATGQAALADDTGLFVTALEGGPGVLTARYGGWERLLSELIGFGEADPGRSAHFETVLVLAWADDRPDLVVNRRCHGSIALTERGDGGFGYDPVFIPAESDGRSFAEMTKAEKNVISHRGRALRALLETVSELT